MCNSCSDDSCSGCLQVPKGDQGDPGAPGILAINFITSGAPVSDSSGTYITVGEFPFDGTIIDPFTALKANIYVSGNTGCLRIRQKKAPNTVLYENTNISSTSSSNVETATALSIIPSADEVVQVQIKTNNTSFSTLLGSIQFYYGT